MKPSLSIQNLYYPRFYADHGYILDTSLDMICVSLWTANVRAWCGAADHEHLALQDLLVYVTDSSMTAAFEQYTSRGFWCCKMHQLVMDNGVLRKLQLFQL